MLFSLWTGMVFAQFEIFTNTVEVRLVRMHSVRLVVNIIYFCHVGSHLTR